ncbi:MAG: branched-chain amino acid ABC transporter substrate-binding protein [Solirubrobacteraceae bacterium]
MKVRRFAAGASLLGATAVLISACGSSNGGGGGGGSCVSGNTLTIYSSLPFDPTDRAQSTDVVNGEKMALQKANNKVGKYTIKYVSLDDSTPSAGKWEAGKVSSNAREAAQNKATIAYLGEFNSNATAVSLPILNRSGILQISPSNTAVGLTKKSADPAEPDKYYPTGKRTYGRVVPADNIQAAAQVTYMKDQGVKKVYVLDDKEVYGKGVADAVAADAKKAGLQVVGDEGIDPKAANYRSLGAKMKAAGADGFFFGGITANNGVQLWGDVFAANPGIKGFGPDGVAETSFTSKIPESSQPNTFITNPTLPEQLYPPAAKTFFADFKAKYGTDPEPYAIYGYEAMNAALEGIKNAGDKGNCREDVIKGFYNIKNRSSVLGTYSIDPDGDTTITDYGGNTIKSGKLVFDKVIKAQNPSS